MTAEQVVISAVGWTLPQVPGGADQPPWDRCAAGASDPVSILGRKGLLGKDRATVLALAAAVRAAGPLVQAWPEVATGVVVACNLGNLDTVCRVAAEIEAGPTRGLSILDLPNASSNVVASAVAIRLRCRAFNVLVSSGSDAGLHAIRVASNAIRCGRARRMVVVGVESFAAPQRALLGESLARWSRSTPVPPFTEAAAAVVLETASDVVRRGQRPLAVLEASRAAPAGRLAESLPPAEGGRVDVWLPPAAAYPAVAAELAGVACPCGDGGRRFDLQAAFGETYGAAGVLQAAVAADMLFHGEAGRVLVSCGGVCGDGFASLVLSAVSAAAAEGEHD
jgi:3-oxoacyl-[acyl-carrier-protein] synthase II